MLVAAARVNVVRGSAAESTPTFKYNELSGMSRIACRLRPKKMRKAQLGALAERSKINTSL